jgi:hypothetical protein
MNNVDSLLWAETDGACAHCGLKDQRVLSVHHIHPQEPKDESYDNKLLLCHNCHHLHHQGKGASKEDLLAIKERLIRKTLTQHGVNAIKTSRRSGFVVAAPYLVNHLMELGLLHQKEVISTVRTDDPQAEVVAEAIYELTLAGAKFAEKWKLD